MRLKQRIIRALGGRSESEIAEISAKAAKEAVELARQSWPMSWNYDPKGEGYRPLTAGQQRRDLHPITNDRMLEIAYYMYDTSGMVRRFVRDTKNFVLGEGIIINHPDPDALEILNRFWEDSQNLMNIKLESKVEFLGLLGEQCWPAFINPVNGHVKLGYVDPASIAEVHTDPQNVEVIQRVDLKGRMGRSGKKYAVIREDASPMSKTFGRLVGDCFFFAINKPPNSPRGRSDLLPNFDMILTYEEQLFSELDRVDSLRNFIWDVTLSGMSGEDIQEWLRDHGKPPKPNSVRAHNEAVTWQAVTPDLKSHDTKTLFEMFKEYLSGCQNRPSSWFGSGGKAYQLEADLMGEPTFADLGNRQRFVKYMIEFVLRFALDQAVIKGRISAEKADQARPTADMPEMRAKDVGKLVSGVPQLATALAVAVSEDWIQMETASRIFISVVNRLGIEVDVDAEIEAISEAAAKKPKPGEEDYAEE